MRADNVEVEEEPTTKKARTSFSDAQKVSLFTEMAEEENLSDLAGRGYKTATWTRIMGWAKANVGYKGEVWQSFRSLTLSIMEAARDKELRFLQSTGGLGIPLTPGEHAALGVYKELESRKDREAQQRADKQARAHSERTAAQSGVEMGTQSDFDRRASEPTSGELHSEGDQSEARPSLGELASGRMRRPNSHRDDSLDPNSHRDDSLDPNSHRIDSLREPTSGELHSGGDQSEARQSVGELASRKRRRSNSHRDDSLDANFSAMLHLMGRFMTYLEKMSETRQYDSSSDEEQ